MNRKAVVDDVSLLDMDMYGEDPQMMRSIRRSHVEAAALPQHTERTRIFGFVHHNKSHTEPTKSVPKVIKIRIDSEVDQLSGKTESGGGHELGSYSKSSYNNKSSRTISTQGSTSSREQPNSPRPSWHDSKKHRSQPSLRNKTKKSSSERSMCSSSHGAHRNSRTSEHREDVPKQKECTAKQDQEHSHTHKNKHRSHSSRPSEGRSNAHALHRASSLKKIGNHTKGHYLDDLFGSSHTTKSFHRSQRPHYIDRLFDMGATTIHSLPATISTRQTRRRSKKVGT